MLREMHGNDAASWHKIDVVAICVRDNIHRTSFPIEMAQHLVHTKEPFTNGAFIAYVSQFFVLFFVVQFELWEIFCGNVSKMSEEIYLELN